MLTAADLEYMRTSILDLLPDTCDILELSSTPDGQGGQVETWGTATAGTAVACRLDNTGGNEEISGEAVQPFTRWIMSLAYDQTLTEQNRIKHGAYTYNIMSVNNDASWKAVTRAVLERVR